jgi:tetratricopeptide (TPR) repeat protein
MTTLVPILNRNAVRWDDDRKVGAFMTVVQSPVVMGLAGEAATETAELSAAALPRELLVAMRVFETLRSRRIAYRVDPASAYTELSQGSGGIDFLQFPTETLAYAAGDCDDLSVLYNSILEGAGVRTAFITTPGHIYTAFALQRDPQQLAASFADTDELIVSDGVAWIPVETTMLGDGFRAAWQAGARQWRTAESNRNGELIPTDDAWSRFPPVPWEVPAQIAGAHGGKDDFQSELDQYLDETVEQMIAARNVATPRNAREFNIRGTIHARFGRLERASEDFQRAVEMDEYVPAILNLASVAALQGDHAGASQLLERANQISPDNPRILLGLAVQHLENGQRGSARTLYDQAASLDPRLTSAYPLFGSGSDVTGRASEADTIREFHLEAWAE